MALLLNRRGDEVKITDDVVKAAAGNENSGEDLIRLLFDRRGDEKQQDIYLAKLSVGQSLAVRFAASIGNIEIISLKLPFPVTIVYNFPVHRYYLTRVQRE